MVTLSIVVYVTVSLLIARCAYWTNFLDINCWEVNPCYMNVKKSLIQGFSTLPILAAIALVFVGLCYVAVDILVGIFNGALWVFVNMP